nr:hypothetical protein [Tanacetum cinerariifolium]
MVVMVDVATWRRGGGKGDEMMVVAGVGWRWRLLEWGNRGKRWRLVALHGVGGGVKRVMVAGRWLSWRGSHGGGDGCDSGSNCGGD